MIDLHIGAIVLKLLTSFLCSNNIVNLVLILEVHIKNRTSVIILLHFKIFLLYQSMVEIGTLEAAKPVLLLSREYRAKYNNSIKLETLLNLITSNAQHNVTYFNALTSFE